MPAGPRERRNLGLSLWRGSIAMPVG